MCTLKVVAQSGLPSPMKTDKLFSEIVNFIFCSNVV